MEEDKTREELKKKEKTLQGAEDQGTEVAQF